jgi:cystathionine beta-lyase/cystathionine gamma-synthase
MRKETRCIHSGTLEDSIAGGINSPVFPSSAFNYLEGGDIPYPRYFNTPNQKAVIDKIAALEGAEDGVLFSSGMAAMSTAILAFAAAGDHVVMMDESMEERMRSLRTCSGDSESNTPSLTHMQIRYANAYAGIPGQSLSRRRRTPF